MADSQTATILGGFAVAMVLNAGVVWSVLRLELTGLRKELAEFKAWAHARESEAFSRISHLEGRTEP